MPAPTYTLTNFSYTPSSGKLLLATISQVIDSSTWIINKRVTGTDAETIWNARGETEAQLITRILAA